MRNALSGSSMTSSIESGLQLCGDGCECAAMQESGRCSALRYPPRRAPRAGLRQLAAVLLKHLIHRHWNAADHAFEPPEVVDQEKATMRKHLLDLLFQVPSNVSTPLAVCVTAIANWDFPEEWPDLLPTLLQAITADSTNDSQVRPVANPAMRNAPAGLQIITTGTAGFS
jgi:Importin-beta N-terminal domain